MRIPQIPAALVAALIATLVILTAGTVQASNPPKHTPTSPEIPAPPADSAAAAAPASDPNTTHDLTTADVSAWLDGLLNYGLKTGDIAGAVVAVVKDGKVLFQSGYGYADVAKKTPMDPDHVMTRIGSTSKLFTWTAVMQLVEQGKLDLNRNVDDYLDFKVSPPGGKPITLLDLMNHRGGFEEGLKDLLALDPHALMSTETYLKQHPRPLMFPPGTVPAYSNYGTALAGYIVERVSGEPYAHYIDQHIFQPLGMQHSTFEQPLPQRFKGMNAQGYRSASEPPQPYELVITAPAGSVATTASDMTRFMLAHLQQGHLGSYDMLTPETTQLMHTPSESAPPGFATMAHGFFHEARNGHLVIGHGGDSIFFHTELDLLPTDGVGIFYSFNSRGRDQAVYGLRKAVLDQFMDRYFPDTSAALAARATPAPSASPTAPATSEPTTPPSAPATPTTRDPATLTSSPANAQKIAGRYESSRRVEHGFLSVFYLFQQTVIRANPDGTITAPKSFEPGEAVFQEITPDLWREVDGTHQLALRNINGINTVLDSEDPTSVLQAVPPRKAAPLNLIILMGSLLILTVAVIVWPISYLVRRHYRPLLAAQPPAQLPTQPPETQRWRTLLRIAAAYGLLWLLGWTIVLTPVLSVQLDFYSKAHDPLIRTLQLGGLLVIAAAALGVWSFWRLGGSRASSWPTRIGNAMIAAALLGLVWIGFVGQLMSFNLNY
jgi:CubicO group peptidase (beta-lactamase class C family)